MDSLYFKEVQDKWVLANHVRPHSANPGTGVPKCLASNSATPPVRSLASIDYHKPIERGRAPSRPLAIDEEWNDAIHQGAACGGQGSVEGPRGAAGSGA